MIVMASVLYPYIYMVRIAFRLTPSSLSRLRLSTNPSSGQSAAAGTAGNHGRAGLSDGSGVGFRTVEYFAVETLTLGIFNVWLGMNNIVAAAQISLFGFVFILFLGLELYARSRQRFGGSAKPAVDLKPLTLDSKGRIACQLVCALPLCLGFVIPVGVLLKHVLAAPLASQFGQVFETVVSILMAAGAAVIIVIVSTLVVLAATYRGGVALRRLSMAASSGYAIPGTMLAIGVLIFAGVVGRAMPILWAIQGPRCFLVVPVSF